MAWLLVLVPVLGGLALWVAGRRRVVLAPGAAVVVGTTIALGVWAAASEATASLAWGSGLGLSLSVTGFGRVMVVLVPTVALAVVLYAVGAERDDPALARLVGLLVVFVGAMELLVAADDLLAVLFGWELVGALSWVLIGHHWRDPTTAPRAAHAFVTTRFGDAGLYIAAGAAFAGAGSLSYAALGGLARPWLDVVAAGVLLAAAAKSAQVPFAPWLFSAMAGPTPVSALLHSATMVAAGAYLLIRLGPAFEPLPWFGPAAIAIGTITALAGGVVAFVQTDFKKALAASTSAQYGLMFIAIGAGSVSAAGLQLVVQAAFKALLFLGAGVAIHASGSGDLRTMRLGVALPKVAALVGVGVLALAAVPPTGGAVSKEAILAAGVEAGPWVGGGVLLAGLLSALYGGRLQLLAYGGGGGRGASRHEVTGRRPGALEVGAMAALAAATIAMSVLWLAGARRVSEEVFGKALIESSAWELPASVASIVLGLAIVWMLDRRGSLAEAGLVSRKTDAWQDWLALPRLARMFIVDPTLALARFLAQVDDRVIDAGVRFVVALAAATSRLASWWGERGIDGVVWGVAGATLRTADGLRVADDRGVDRAVESIAAGVGVAGRQSRRLQGGLTHHYYVIAGIGLLVALATATLWR